MPRNRGVLWTVCSFELLLLVAAGGCRQAPTAESRSAIAKPTATSSSARLSGHVTPGAVVTIEGIGLPSAPPPAGPAVMDQYSKQFIPDLLFVRVGQVVEFRNSEDENHNVQVLRLPTGTTIMSESGSKGQVFEHVFDQPGTFDVNCDVHPGMRATIVATTTPFAAMADGRGDFTIENVPPGKYVLKSTANGQETTRTIDVVVPQTVLPAR
jgi:plastocyanin